MFRSLYGLFAYLGVVAFPAAFIMGYRHEAEAPLANLAFNVLLYVLFIAIHIAMTLPAFKRAVFGRPEGTTSERQI